MEKKKQLRFIFGIFLTVLFCCIVVYFFNMAELIKLIIDESGDDFVKFISYMLMSNFTFDPIAIIQQGTPTSEFLLLHIIVWLFLGYFCGAIIKNLKKGIIAMVIVVVSTILLWIVFTTISGIDLTGFSAIDLIAILIAFIGSLFGVTFGSLITGIENINTGKFDSRFTFSILIPLSISFFTLYLFSIDVMITQIEQTSGTDIIRVISLMLYANFRFDAISMFTGGETPLGFFAPQILMWFYMAFICGTIAKGAKRGLTASLILVIISILLWILFSVLSSIDLMSLFTGTELIYTLGGMAIALVGGLLGGLLGGLISGPYPK